MADRDDGATRQRASAQQPLHEEPDRQARSERQEGGRDDAGTKPAGEVPQGGMNPEVGDLDDEADPGRDIEQGGKQEGSGVPGKMGGGLLGG